MDELISRQAAIDALMNNEPSAWNNDDYERGEIARFREDITIIRNVPSVRQKRKPSVQPEIKPIEYRDCANAMMRMWMDKVVTDGEYNRIMDKLNEHWERRENG